MLRFLAQRLLLTAPVLFLVATLVFLLIHLVPGDPVQQMLGESARAEEVNQIRHDWGLDLPLRVQYAHFMRGLLHADLGRSFKFNQPVRDVVLSRYPATLQLTLASLLVALLLAIPGGVQSAVWFRRWQDRLLAFLSLLGLSFPTFALGPVLILVFSIFLGWLPVSGRGSVANLILPAFTMGSALAAILLRMVRGTMLDELRADYVRTARAKGLRERAVVYRHALRNSLIPVLTVVGLQFGSLLAGAIVTETIFSWPGLGRLTLQAISARDYPLTQGCLLAIAGTYIAVNLITDLLYSVLDPRIRAAA
jgi:ABC-type dipeptide/oligopeptide/nickel transport system permease component